MPNIVVGIVYLEDLATLKFILKKLIRTNSPPPPQKKTTSGEMAIVLGTFTSVLSVKISRSVISRIVILKC